MPCMALAAAGMLAMIAVCGRAPLTEAGYLCARAFMLAEFAAALEWQLYTYIVQLVPAGRVPLRVLVPAVVYAGVYLLMYWLESRRRGDYEHLQITSREMGAAAAITVSAFFMSNLSYAWSDNPFGGSLAVDIFNTRTLVDLGGMAILYAYHVQRAELRVKYELNAIQNILQTPVCPVPAKPGEHRPDQPQVPRPETPDRRPAGRAGPGPAQRLAGRDGGGHPGVRGPEQDRQPGAGYSVHRQEPVLPEARHHPDGGGGRRRAEFYGHHGPVHHLRQCAGQRH